MHIRFFKEFVKNNLTLLTFKVREYYINKKYENQEDFIWQEGNTESKNLLENERVLIVTMHGIVKI